MDIQFTARRFRAHPEVKTHAIEAVEKLGKFYDGIVRADVILSYERGTNSIKTAEINLHVYGVVLFAKERSEDFVKSINAATEKLGNQLKKYKGKLRSKDKVAVRSLQAKV